MEVGEQTHRKNDGCYFRKKEACGATTRSFLKKGIYLLLRYVPQMWLINKGIRQYIYALDTFIVCP